MQSLSIIIPVFGELENAVFEETLVSVLENRPERSEVLVASFEEYEDQWNIESEGVRFVNSPGESSPVRLLNRAISESTAPIVHVLSCGTTVYENWANSALARFNDDNVASVAVLVLDRENRKKILSSGISWRRGGKVRMLNSPEPLRRKFSVVAPHAAAGFFRKAALEEIQGFIPRYVQQISYLDASLLMAELGWHSVQDSGTRVFASSENLPKVSHFLWSKQCEQLYQRWIEWGGTPQAFFGHLGYVLGTTLKEFPKLKMLSGFLGHLAGLGHFGAYRHRINTIEELREHNAITREKAEREEYPESVPFVESLRRRHLADAA